MFNKLHNSLSRSLIVYTAIVLHTLFSSQVVADPEKNILQALDAIQSSNITKAKHILTTLISKEPEFKLAHMLYADLLKSRATPLNHAGMGIKNSEKLNELLDEARLRYEANQELKLDNGKT